jgi:hypothetical protein
MTGEVKGEVCLFHLECSGADDRMVMILKRKMRMRKKMERRVGKLKKMRTTRRMRKKRRNVMRRVSSYHYVSGQADE